jgi:hypothetical protein
VNDVPATTETPIINIPLKIEEIELEDDIYALPATSPATTADSKRKFEPPNFTQDTTHEFIQNFWEDQVDPNAVPMSPTQLLNIFTQTDSLNALDTIRNQGPQFTYALPPAHQPKVLYPQLDNVQPSEIRTYSPDSGPMQEGAKILICVHGFSFFDQYLFPQSSAPQMQQQVQQQQQAKGGAPKSRKKAVNASPSSSAPATHPTTMSSINNNNVYYYSFWCVFDFGVEVPATVAPIHAKSYELYLRYFTAHSTRSS